MRLKLTRQLYRLSHLKKHALYAAAASAVVLLYVANINNFPPLGNESEQAVRLSVNSGTSIINNISFAPQKAADYIIFKLGHEGIVNFRVVSATFVVLAVITFFVLIKQWLSTRVAFMAGLLFATSSWVLFSARSAELDAIMLFAIPAILLAGTLLKIKEYDSFLPLTTFLAALTLYIPGFWVFVLTGGLMLRSDLYEAWQMASAKARLLWASAFLLPLIPLSYGLVKGNNLLEWLGYLNEFSIKDLLLTIVSLPNRLLISGINDSWSWVYGTPVIDAITSGLAILGIAYVVIDKRFPVRRNTLIGLLAAVLVLIGLAGESYIGLLLPLLYIFAAFGIAFLLEQWFHIFPLNPMARITGIIIVSIMLLAVATYHTSRYFYVWPKSHSANEIFKQ